MEAVLNASHDLIVREYLSEFVNENLMPPAESKALDDFICPLSCPTSPTTSFPKYQRISLTLATCRARPRRSTQGRNRKYHGV